MKARSKWRRASRRVVVASLLATLGGVAAAGCASDGGAGKSSTAGSSASSGADKFCGRRMDTDCDPRNRSGSCENK